MYVVNLMILSLVWFKATLKINIIVLWFKNEENLLMQKSEGGIIWNSKHEHTKKNFLTFKRKFLSTLFPSR